MNVFYKSYLNFDWCYFVNFPANEKKSNNALLIKMSAIMQVQGVPKKCPAAILGMSIIF